ncbi:hypothetical protein YC2023_099549 [Brassica napus]
MGAAIAAGRGSTFIENPRLYIPEWKLEKADRSLICGAYRIAQSVVVWDLPQSYVATSYFFLDG